MENYLIRRCNGTPDWEALPALPIDRILWLPDAGIRAEAKLCYDDEGIHVQLRAYEKNIRAEYTDRLGMPCEDSCLEFFFRPMENDIRYFNIEFNPNGCLYLGIAHGRYDAIRMLPRRNQMVPEIHRFDGGWQVSYTVPYAFIHVFFPDFKAESGKCIYANFYKCGDETVQPHYLAAFPIDLETPEFHCPQFFQKLSFE